MGIETVVNVLPKELLSMPNSTSNSELHTLIESLLESHAAERKARDTAFINSVNSLRDEFSKAIGGIRTDFRLFGVVMLLGILALAGVNVVGNILGSDIKLNMQKANQAAHEAATQENINAAQ